eukprot:gnl/TRDRNA2_/TRDRNA2_52049_c0_seq1.p1 gnl/TRDRNA2_/TRDRNA2_52049_c0~~gnl/TRDRNA2_/TRDRNA2_52049_c0_seq1.p1  ORF type:complete len:241 (+),score=50.26 gnl/TRDRNA2_/TRDRNA2_52049_c0_seq1:100-822(+)
MDPRFPQNGRSVVTRSCRGIPMPTEPPPPPPPMSAATWPPQRVQDEGPEDFLLYESAPPDWMKTWSDEDEETAAPASDGVPDASSGASDDEWPGSGASCSPCKRQVAASPVVPENENPADLERGSMESSVYLPGMGMDPAEAMIPVERDEGKRRGDELLAMLGDFNAKSAIIGVPPPPPPVTRAQVSPTPGNIPMPPPAKSVPMPIMGRSFPLQAACSKNTPRVVPPRARQPSGGYSRPA